MLGTLEGSLWYQQSETEELEGDDSAFGFTLRAPNAEGFRGGIGYLTSCGRTFSPRLDL